MIHWVLNSIGFYVCLALFVVAMGLPAVVLGWAGSQLLPHGGMLIGTLLGLCLAIPALRFWTSACQTFQHAFSTIPCVPLRRKPDAGELGWQRYFTAFVFLPFHVAAYLALLFSTSPGQVGRWLAAMPLATPARHWLTPTDEQFRRLTQWSAGSDPTALFNRTFWEGYWPVHLGMLACLLWTVAITAALAVETLRRWMTGPAPYRLAIDRTQHPDDLELLETVGEASVLGRALYWVPPWLFFNSRRAARVVWGEPLWLLASGAFLAAFGVWFAASLLLGAALRFEGAVASHLRKRRERFGVIAEVLRFLTLERRAHHRNSIVADVVAARGRATSYVE